MDFNRRIVIWVLVIIWVVETFSVEVSLNTGAVEIETITAFEHTSHIILVTDAGDNYHDLLRQL